MSDRLAVMLSVRGKWISKMAKGAKVEEVRKFRPSIEPPYKCYLYCSLAGDTFMLGDCPGNGHVVGEFICNAVNEYGRSSRDIARLSSLSCVPMSDLHHYFGRRATIYGWHVSELLIYDKPLPITTFNRPCPNRLRCESCAMYQANSEVCGNRARIMQAPQSWCYVEEVQTDAVPVL